MATKDKPSTKPVEESAGGFRDHQCGEESAPKPEPAKE